MEDNLIAVTGGSGFVGSHVVDALLGAGYEVRVIDPKKPMQDEADWADVDMLDQDAVTDAVKGAAAVFHLAAMADVNDIVADPAGSVALNTLGVARVLEVDNVVICAGQEPMRELRSVVEALGITVHLVGGADVAAELDAKRAIEQATKLALAI